MLTGEQVQTQLLERAAAGDDVAVTEVVELYFPRVTNFAERLGSRDPEVIANESLLATISRLPTLHEYSPPVFRAYLFRTARNRVVDEKRRAAARPNIVESEPFELIDLRSEFEDGVADRDLAQDLLAQLTPAQREVVTYRFIDDLSLEKTAELTGKPLSSVKALQRRAIRALRAATIAIVLVILGVIIARSTGGEIPEEQRITSEGGDAATIDDEGQEEGAELPGQDGVDLPGNLRFDPDAEPGVSVPGDDESSLGDLTPIGPEADDGADAAQTDTVVATTDVQDPEPPPPVVNAADASLETTSTDPEEPADAAETTEADDEAQPEDPEASASAGLASAPAASSSEAAPEQGAGSPAASSPDTGSDPPDTGSTDTGSTDISSTDTGSTDSGAGLSLPSPELVVGGTTSDDDQSEQYDDASGSDDEPATPSSPSSDSPLVLSAAANGAGGGSSGAGGTSSGDGAGGAGDDGSDDDSATPTPEPTPTTGPSPTAVVPTPAPTTVPIAAAPTSPTVAPATPTPAPVATAIPNPAPAGDPVTPPATPTPEPPAPPPIAGPTTAPTPIPIVVRQPLIAPPQNTPVPTAAPTPTSTVAPSPTPSPAPTLAATPVPSPTSIPTTTTTPTPTSIPTPTARPTTTSTPVPTATAAPTATTAPTSTPAPTATATPLPPTPTAAPSATAAPTPTPVAALTMVPTPTALPTPTPTAPPTPTTAPIPTPTTAAPTPPPTPTPLPPTPTPPPPAAPREPAAPLALMFSHQRGFFDDEFTLDVTANNPDASIWISTEWGAEADPNEFRRTARPYAGPVTITDTTQVRAFAVAGSESTEVESHTFMSYATALGAAADSPQARQALETYPIIEVSAALPTVLNNEVPAHVELIWPSGSRPDVSVLAGVERHGNTAFTGQAGYHRLSFRPEYGTATLDVELFHEGSGAQLADSYAHLDLHGGGVDSFGYPVGGGFGCTGGAGVLMRDRFYQNLQRAATGDGIEGDYFLVFDQGRFAGVRNVEAVPTQQHMAANFGAQVVDYAVVRHDGSDGPTTALTAIDTPAETFGLRDLPNFIDYHLIQWISGRTSWPQAGYVTAGRYDGPFYNWVSNNQASQPGCYTGLGQAVGYWPSTDPDFLLAVADRILLHFFDDGVLTPDQLAQRWNALAATVAPALDLPITRGYYGTPYTRATWETAQQTISAALVTKSDTLVPWFRSSGYLPTVNPPRAQLIDGSQRRVQLTIDEAVSPPVLGALQAGAESGTIYFTLDGSDPRLPGGEVSPTAQIYTGPIAIGDGTVEVFARQNVAGQWSAASPALFSATSPNGGLQIATATGVGIRITNNGDHPVDLEYFRVQGDVRYKFDYGRSPVIAPGGLVTLMPTDYLGDLDFSGPLILVGPQLQHIDDSFN